MPTITSTELGAVGRYINLGTHASQNNNLDTTWLIYCKPTGVDVASYFFAKTPSATATGMRAYYTTTKQPSAGTGSTGVANAPYVMGTADEIVYNTWQHVSVSFANHVSSDLVVMRINGAPIVKTDWGAGATAMSSDAANDLFLMNRGNSGALGRAFVGSVAYIARWSRALTEGELTEAKTNGPLNVPSGLTLLWANNQDYSTNAITPVARSTFVAGDLPPNLALGGVADPNGSVTGGTGTGTGSGTGGNATGVDSGSGSVTGGTGTGTGSGTGGNATGVISGNVTGGTGTGTGSGTGGNAVGGIGAGSITVGPLENSPGSLWLSQSVAWTWAPLGRVGGMTGITVIDGTGTTHATTGVLTVSGLAPGEGELRVVKLGDTAFDDLHYVEYGTAV